MDQIEALERLTALRDKGALSEEEFQSRKAALLAGPTIVSGPPARRGRGRTALVVGCLLLVAALTAAAFFLLSSGPPIRPATPPQPAERPAPPQPAAPAHPVLAERTLHEWDGEDDGDKTYQVGPVTLAFAAKPGEDDAKATVLTLSAPGVVDRSFTFGTRWASAGFGVGPIDPKQGGPQVIVTSFSGGAHCCTEVTVIAVKDGRWTMSSLGAWDGEGPGLWPEDIDGDGGADFTLADNAFLYVFDSYAGSWPPLMVWGMRGGKPVDLSKRAAFRPLFEKDMAASRKECETGRNAACAAFVADAARLGRKDWAWPIMLAAYDRNSDWELPTGCSVETVEGACPAGMEIKFETFPEALDWFLRETGYL